uniref:Uncharacterized protein n=1 Tax=Physcomitrium patens TaxID=3218 RepID=A0A2K1KWW8_PHYPA|nr:hypothetical protein PHYPA_005256 [Physcomitrium patens]
MGCFVFGIGRQLGFVHWVLILLHTFVGTFVTLVIYLIDRLFMKHLTMYAHL